MPQEINKSPQKTEYQDLPTINTGSEVQQSGDTITPEFLVGAELKTAQETTRSLLKKINNADIANTPSPAEIIAYLKKEGIEQKIKYISPAIYREIERALSETMHIKRGSDFTVMHRHRQDAILKERIAELIKESNGDLAKVGGRLAVITFDVRGLKTVNDITHDHDMGDTYLEAIARMADNYRQEVMIPLLKQMGITPSSSLARIGGDEFSIMLESTQNRLNEPGWTLDKLLAMLDKIELTEEVKANIEGVKVFLTQNPVTAELTLAQALNELLNYYVPNQAFSTEGKRENGKLSTRQIEEGYIFSRTQLAEHLGEELDKNYKYRGYIGTGVATLQTLLDSPVSGMYKRDLNGNETPEKCVGIIMGALRSCSDAASYAAKEAQTLLWTTSELTEERQHYKISARNNATINLMQELEVTTQELWKDKTKLAKTKAQLNATRNLMQELEVTTQELWKDKTELAKTKAKLAECEKKLN